MKKVLCLAALVLSTASAFAASPWDGTWKFNHAKSKLSGTTLTVTRKDGKYLADLGSFKFTYACDGKDYPVVDNHTSACVEKGNITDYTDKTAGKVVSTEHEVLSADGKTIHGTSKNLNADGSSTTGLYVETRIGTGTGFAGTWKRTEDKSDDSGLVVYKLNGEVLHMEIPSDKSIADMKLDGTPAKLIGPTMPPSFQVTTKRVTANRFEISELLDGKILDVGFMTLSADGKTIHQENWDPTKPTEKRISVFEKQ